MSNFVAKAKRLSSAYNQAVKVVVYALLVISGLGILVMIALTCLDVVSRTAFNAPVKGAFDIVRLAGAVSIACALPYTTAVKGHVAIEFFFQKLSRRGRVVVDTLARSLGMALFSVFSWRCVVYGNSLKRSGEVTPTIDIPIFWVLYLMAFCCGVMVLVILWNLLHPGREMIKP